MVVSYICLFIHFCFCQEMIEQYVHWNEDIGEWQLKCVAYTGNNMRKQTPLPDKNNDKVRSKLPMLVYLFRSCYFLQSLHLRMN